MFMSVVICFVLTTGGESIDLDLSQTNLDNMATKQNKALAHVSGVLGTIHQQVKETITILKTIDQNLNYKTNKTLQCLCNNTRRISPVARQSTENYLSLAFTKLLEQIGIKNDFDLIPIFEHAEAVLNQVITTKRLSWLQEPMTQVLHNIAHLAAHNVTEFMRKAIYYHFSLTHRSFKIRCDIRNIIDFADSMVFDIDGEYLFRVVSEFRDHPFGQKTNIQLCLDIIEAFEKPFTKLNGKGELQKLVNLANKALLLSYPELGSDNAQKTSTETVPILRNQVNYSNIWPLFRNN